MLNLDHFAFGTGDLPRGVARMTELLGTGPLSGGKHPLFGTHNALWRLETAVKPVYLEVIAVDPGAPPPVRRRWFGLDDPGVQARFAEGLCLLTFVANTPDLAAARKTMPVDPGAPLEVRRDDLVWQFTLPQDGGLVAGGALPYLIEWPPGARPVDTMADQNIRLTAVGGVRLGELTMNWPCPVEHADAALEITLLSARGKTVVCASNHTDHLNES